MKNGYHPNIIVPKGRKECDYFSYKLDEDSPFGNYTTMFAGNTAAGSALKGRCKLAYDNNYQPILRAEASPNYLVHPWAASRAKTWLPDTKILVILRGTTFLVL
jgi:hypothetical protein